MPSRYVGSVPINKVILDLHRFSKTQSLLILGPPGVGKSEGIREFAIQEILRMQKDIEIRHNRKMPILLLDNPYGMFKTLDGKQISIKPTDSIIFIDTTKSGAVINGRLLNFYVRDLLNAGNLVYVYVDIRLSEVEPPDLVGLPTLIQSGNSGISYSNYASNIFVEALSIDKSYSAQNEFEKEIKKVHGVLFLDEFTNINRADVLSMAFKIVLDRMIGYRKISSGVRIIAAGNQAENSSLSKDLPSPLVNRFFVIHTQKPSVESWHKYMLKQIASKPNADILRQVTNLLTMFFMDKDAGGRYFLTIDIPPRTLEPFPTPRSWTNAVFSVNCKEIDESCFEFFKYSVGVEATQKFLSWFKDKRVAFSEEMLKYSKEQLDEYFARNEVYNNRNRFAAFLNSYQLTIEDKNIWDHDHDLRIFFNNLIELVNQHKNEIERQSSGETVQGTYYQEYMRLISLAYKKTLDVAGDDYVDKPLFRGVTIELKKQLDDLLTNLPVNEARKYVKQDPIYCIEFQLMLSQLMRTNVGHSWQTATRKLLEVACKDIVPLFGYAETGKT